MYAATTHRPLPRMTVLAILGVTVLLAFAFLFHFRLFVTSGPSMEPTYTPGTYVLAHRLYGDPAVGETVFLEYNGKICLKRVAFIAGEDVSQAGYEGYWGSNIVPEGYVFVLGDNPDHSLDSRDPKFGLVSLDNINWKPVLQK